MSRQKIICVVGPTASGKTELGVGVAQAIGGEVISADSMQIYRGMSIASAAPTKDEMMDVPHHLVEFLPYGESFTVAQYVDVARQKITEILSRGKTPVIVGGTGLYINSIVDNIEFTPQEDTAALREKITARFDELGAETMLAKLREIDSTAADKLHPSDKRRIIRAFEIYEGTGLTPTQHNISSRSRQLPYDAVMIGINYRERKKLYDRINLRVDKMLYKGLLDEARIAFAQNRANEKSGAVQAIGHKELFPYFAGQEELEVSVERLKQSSRRYAKRQITWFSRDSRIHWIYRDECNDALSAALDIINKESEG